MSQTAKFGILKNRATNLIKLKINKIAWDKHRQTKGYYKILWYFLLICGIQKAGVFCEDFPPNLWIWNVHVTSQITLEFYKIPNLAVCNIFSYNIFLHLT